MTNDYRLICGDANKVIPRLAEEGVKVDMVFCSPNPLFFSLRKDSAREQQTKENVGSEHTLEEYVRHLCVIFAKVRMILKETGSLWVHMMDTYMMRGSMTQVPERFALTMTGPGNEWLLRGKRIWLRGVHEVTEGPNIFAWDWEYVYWFTQSEEYVWNAVPCTSTSVIDALYTKPLADGGSGFPYKVINEAMYTTTTPGDTVLDMFMGSGETGIAALNEGRKFIGIDLFPEKVALAQRRLRHLSP